MAINSSVTNGSQSAGPVWPVWLAPAIAGIYYLAVKFAFTESIVSVMGRADLFEIPHWGPHWAFRIAAEVISIGFATFVAAGLAHGREKLAAVVGGCTISLGFVIKIAIVYTYRDAIAVPEPWYQYVIDVLSITFAPFIGAFVSESAADLHRLHPKGVGGVNKFHFLWLWFITYFYALGLITPVGRLYALGDANVLALTITLVINGIPAAAIAIPGYYGLAFLAGSHGETMHPAGRNMVGVIVLISGLLIGVGIQFGWYWIFQRIHDAIFG
jgi:hypothetical protein